MNVDDARSGTAPSAPQVVRRSRLPRSRRLLLAQPSVVASAVARDRARVVTLVARATSIEEVARCHVRMQTTAVEARHGLVRRRLLHVAMANARGAWL